MSIFHHHLLAVILRQKQMKMFASEAANVAIGGGALTWSAKTH
jgi:hypothetical protein